MPYRTLLDECHLSVVSGQADFELRHLEGIIEQHVTVHGRGDLEALLGRLLIERGRVDAIVPKTLDFIGHSRAAASLLTLGDWVIDARSPTVTAFFRELADHDVLPRLGIHALRLLGCKTADTGQGRATICTLSDILGLDVYGTNHLLYDAHYGPHGFRDDWKFLLVCSSDLRHDPRPVFPRPRDRLVDPQVPEVVLRHDAQARPAEAADRDLLLGA
jgi:hypothetical protein